MKLLKWLLLFLLGSILLQGSLSYEASIYALNFWFEKLVPAMFVTMVLVNLCLHYASFDIFKFLFKPLAFLFNCTPQSLSCILSAIFLGAPASCVILSDLVQKKQLESAQAKRLVLCLSLSTPAFIIMTCGALFLQDIQLGFLLYGLQVLIVCLFLCLYREPFISIKTTSNSIPFFITLKKAITSNALALFYIGGYLVMTLTLYQSISWFLPNIMQIIGLAIIEFSLGISLIHQTSLSITMKFALFSLCLGFNGLCVHLQVFSLGTKLQLNYKEFLCFRVFQALITSLLGVILLSLLQ